MTDQDPESLEFILAKYRPAEAPADLLCRVEQAALRSRRTWQGTLAAALSTAAEILLGLIVQTPITAAAVIVLLLVAAGGY
jgi:hypothetical protein